MKKVACAFIIASVMSTTGCIGGSIGAGACKALGFFCSADGGQG